jgi:hypothetical protein
MKKLNPKTIAALLFSFIVSDTALFMHGVEAAGGGKGGNAGSLFAPYFSKLGKRALEDIVKNHPTELTKRQILAIRKKIATSRIELTNARLCWNAEDGACEAVAALIAKNSGTTANGEFGRIQVNPVLFWSLPTAQMAVIALHEYLGLEGIENDGTPISGLVRIPTPSESLDKDDYIFASFSTNDIFQITKAKDGFYPGHYLADLDGQKLARDIACRYLGYKRSTYYGTAFNYASERQSSYTFSVVSPQDGTISLTANQEYTYTISLLTCVMPIRAAF